MGLEYKLIFQAEPRADFEAAPYCSNHAFQVVLSLLSGKAEPPVGVPPPLVQASRSHGGRVPAMIAAPPSLRAVRRVRVSISPCPPRAFESGYVGLGVSFQRALRTRLTPLRWSCMRRLLSSRSRLAIASKISRCWRWSRSRLP